MDASLSHTTGIYQPLRFFKRFVAVEAIKLDRNQIKRLVLACRFDLTGIDFGNYRSPRSISGLEGADGEPFVVRNAVSIGWHGAIYGRKGENGMTTLRPSRRHGAAEWELSARRSDKTNLLNAMNTKRTCRVHAKCPLLALSKHSAHCSKCPLLGAKRTCLVASQMSAFDPKRTSVGLSLFRFEQLRCPVLSLGGGNEAARIYQAVVSKKPVCARSSCQEERS